MYEKMPTAAELEGRGLTLEDFEGDEVEVFPENWQAFCLFSNLQTQWRVGMDGATGLDYGALYPLLDRATENADEWDSLFSDIQILEQSALKEMSKK